MTDEQEADKIVWTPSVMIERLGREIDNEESIYYWCAKVKPLPLLYPSPLNPKAMHVVVETRLCSVPTQ